MMTLLTLQMGYHDDDGGDALSLSCKYYLFLDFCAANIRSFLQTAKYFLKKVAI